MDTDGDGKVSLLEFTHGYSVEDDGYGREVDKFRAADEDDDEHLDNQELVSAIFPETNDAVARVITANALKIADTNHDSMLDLKEFESGEAEDMYDDEHRSIAVDFRKLDIDGDGKLSYDELLPWESGLYSMTSDISKLHQLGDVDDDGHLTADEISQKMNLISSSAAHYRLRGLIDHAREGTDNMHHEDSHDEYPEEHHDEHHQDHFPEHMGGDPLTLEGIRTLTKVMDKDSNGLLEMSEMIQHAKDMEIPIAKKSTDAPFFGHDPDGDGLVSLVEWTRHFDTHDRWYDLEVKKFQAADVNGDGSLNSEEIMTIWHPWSSSALADLLAEDKLLHQDKDHDGLLNFTEYLDDVSEESEDSQEHVRDEKKRFHKLDTDGDGKLNFQEVLHLETGEHDTQDMFMELFKLADGNSDGSLSLEELEQNIEAINGHQARYRLVELSKHASPDANTAPSMEDEYSMEHEFSSQEIVDLHGHMDRNGDGRVTRDEALTHAREMRRVIDRDTIDEVMPYFDTDGDGTVSITEYKSHSVNADEHFVVKKFEAADVDQNEKLDKEELISAWFHPETAGPVASVLVEEKLAERDRDGDLQLTLDETFPHSESETTRNLFRELDLDGSDKLDEGELLPWVTGFHHVADQVLTLFTVADADADGELTIDEMDGSKSALGNSHAFSLLRAWNRHAAAGKDALTPEMLRELHVVMDKDGDGGVSLSEAFAHARKAARHEAWKKIDSLKREYDLNRDGRITLSEFKTAHQMLDSNELGEIQFIAADENKDGTLNAVELVAATNPHTSLAVGDAVAKHGHTKMDANGDGYVDLAEFVHDEQDMGGNSGLETEFRRLDVDSNGKLDLEEYHPLATGDGLARSVLVDFFKGADVNGDGVVTIHEIENQREVENNSDAYIQLRDWSKLEKEYAKSIPPQQLQDLHALMDKNKDGKVTIDEMLSHISEARRSHAVLNMNDMFASTDKNSDGKLSFSEVTDITKSESMSKFKAADEDGDRTLNIREFVSIYEPETSHAVSGVIADEFVLNHDKDHDSQLSKLEFTSAQAGPQDHSIIETGEASVAEEDREFEMLDKDHDGLLDHAEMLDWAMGRHWIASHLSEIMDVADQDGDGYITEEELRKAGDTISLVDGHYLLEEAVEVQRHPEL
eukprot:TRINITY_DN19516_c0_g1_i1.p1 TRINITY_DN19516_c0_g1~~TRINITY_DN19516_c0_g1_i1.p1  ORF type:complete len:1319 (-),score=286.99 TRINITY_DN19516_c0_g1_i1:59-3499(-)